MDAHRIGGVNASDENVVTLSLRGGNDLLQQTLADAASSKTRININRVLYRILVGRPCPECPITSKPHQVARIVLDSDDGIFPLRLGVEPSSHHLHRPRLVVVKSR